MAIEISLARIQTDPETNVADAFFKETTVVDDKTFISPEWSKVSWNLHDESKTVTVGDLVLTYAQVSLGVVAIAYQEKAAATPV